MAQVHTVVDGFMTDSTPPTESQKPILIVEDDPDTVWLIRLYLERDGHSVIEARDGIDGLRKALTESPRLWCSTSCCPAWTASPCARDSGRSPTSR